MLGASKRGTQSQSIDPSTAMSAPVWQSDRNAYESIGGNGDGIAALWPLPGLMTPIQGSCQRPEPSMSWSASLGPHRYRARTRAPAAVRR